ncbi:MAG: transcription-repair coupling factor, partial [Sphingobacterium sp.]
IGSADAMVAASSYQLDKKLHVYILPTHEDAAYFLTDLESLFDKQILFFPASFRKAFEFTQADSSHVLQRAETLSSLNRKSESPQIVVTYPEAIAEKVINREDLDKNTLAITQNTKLSIDFINEFLYEYDFERVDFVYEPGQFAIRGGIVDIFSFSNDLPYRIEFFGDEIESIRTFSIETQLSVNKMYTVTIVPNVQAKFLSNNHISLLEYIDQEAVIWLKDVQFTLDVIKAGYKKASEFWKALPEKDILSNPEWIDPRLTFTDHRNFGAMMFEFSIIEFGKQFFYKADQVISFDTHPQPSFNKDFNLLIHNFHENEKHGIANLIFSDSTKQIERIYAILEDLDNSISFTPIYKSLREGFRDDSIKMACYTDHQIFDRYYKYKRKKAYERSQAITLKELSDLKPGDYITHID